MFAYVLDFQAKNGRRELIESQLTSGVLPTLQKQPGFVDLLTLSDTTDPERLVCVSFWTSREATEEYHEQNYREITTLLESVLDSPPALQGFTVKASTAYHIQVDRAA
jgi:heme-degrading monooxygenase HmoA